jgi:tRNA modification GTPase
MLSNHGGSSMARAELPGSDAAPVFALLTPRGRGAVATIRLRGNEGAADAILAGRFRPASGRPLHEHAVGRILFGRLGNEPSEEVIACRRDLKTIDLHCHGGEAAVARIAGDLETLGCRIVSWTDLSAAENGVLASEL